MIGRGGAVDSSQQWYGEFGTVEPGYAIVNEGRLAVMPGPSAGAWATFCAPGTWDELEIHATTYHLHPLVNTTKISIPTQILQ